MTAVLALTAFKATFGLVVVFFVIFPLLLHGLIGFALAQFSRGYEYSWHTPGHTGGTAFLKSPVGRAYFEFFGEALFRSDLSISVGELGSLLDHSGPIGESERYAARVFGAHRTYHVTNGSSMSNCRRASPRSTGVLYFVALGFTGMPPWVLLLAPGMSHFCV